MVFYCIGGEVLIGGGVEIVGKDFRPRGGRRSPLEVHCKGDGEGTYTRHEICHDNRRLRGVRKVRSGAAFAENNVHKTRVLLSYHIILKEQY